MGTAPAFTYRTTPMNRVTVKNSAALLKSEEKSTR